jgi:two-component system cell cycle response regulator DivK
MSTVIVVEDNELNLKLFQDLLSIVGCDVISTRSGYNAIELARANDPDFILMDIQLDGISGIDIIKSIKEDPELQNIPIVTVTACAMSYEEHQIRQSGCDKYITKPVSITDFFAAIQPYLVNDKVVNGKKISRCTV